MFGLHERVDLEIYLRKKRYSKRRKASDKKINPKIDGMKFRRKVKKEGWRGKHQVLIITPSSN
jgi:hypothetical protein